MTSQSDREAKQDIAEVLIRYATGIDGRKWDLFRSCFAPECHIEFEGLDPWDGPEAVTEFMTVAHADMGHTMHRISNIEVEVDGDSAVSRSYVDAVLMSGDGQGGLHPIGRYDDRLIRNSNGWQIVHRKYTMVQFQSIGS